MKVTLVEETYNVNAKVEAPFLVRQYRERSSIRLDVDTPAGRKWTLEMGIRGKDDYSASADFAFKSVNNNNYHLTSDFSWQPLEGYYCFQAESNIKYVSPENRQAHFYVQAKHESNYQHRIIHLVVSLLYCEEANPRFPSSAKQILLPPNFFGGRGETALFCPS